ncbi:MAG: alpha/beta fold hydrolase [Methanomassiliicoccales archaeon]
MSGSRLFYRVKGEGVPVLHLHGFPLDHRLMEGSMEPVFTGREGWKRVYLDQPGMGRSTAGEVDDADDMLEVLVEFLDEVAPGQPLLLVGESYGGYLARGLMHRLPGRVMGIMLVCPVIISRAEDREVPPMRIIHRDGDFLSRMDDGDLVNFRSFAVVHDERSYRHFKDLVEPGLLGGDKEFQERFGRRRELSFQVDPLPEPFQGPCLFLAGRQDWWVGYADAWGIMDSYPRATMAVLDRAGHGLEGEQPELFRTLAAEWLDRVKEYMRET